ncbi:MAG: cell division protein ZapA [Spirochaetales bacterium]|jgi:cell division protein ZapA (FtsZ GTPase activity inhibitor)|nr:cell division protein ZapA [Spirochaetales bacterium]
MSGHLVQISLLGTRFSISTDEDPDYIHRLISDLSRRCAVITETLGPMEPLKTAILACLFLQNELENHIKGNSPEAPLEFPGFKFVLSEEQVRELTEAEKIALSLLENLDKNLK